MGAPVLPARLPEPDAPPSRAATVSLCLFASTWVFAFAPSPSVLATVPGVVGLLAVVERCRRTRHAVGYVMLFGALAIGFGYRWLAGTVRTFGELDERVGALAGPVSWLLLVAYGVAATIHLVLFAVLHRAMLARGRRPHPLATALLFVACEVLPVRFLPWMAGYGAVDVGPLRQAAEWGGVAGVSFALLCLAVPVHEWAVWALGREGSGPPARPRAALATFLVGAVLAAVGAYRLAQVRAEDASATAHLRVGIVQADVGSTAKRDAERRGQDQALRNRQAYEEGTRHAAARGAELIVWPETALVEGFRVWDAVGGRPLPRDAVDAGLRSLGYGFVPEVGRDRAILLGGYEDQAGPPDASGRRGRVRYNVAALREAGGTAWSVYRKVKLMPFGEAMPGSRLVPALDDLLPQAVRMSPGDPRQPPLAWKGRGLSIAAFVCYEGILPDFVAARCGPSRPDLLVNLTNDSWYGDTWEPHQHLDFARFRAVEHRVPLLRATNTGISAVVASSGDVTDRLPLGVAGEIVADVPLVSRGRTPYAVLAPWLPWAWWAAAALAVVVSRRRRPAP